jgi:L-asparagine transporter-like permease
MSDAWMLLLFVAAGLLLAVRWFAEDRFWAALRRLDRAHLLAIGALIGMVALVAWMIAVLRSDPSW